MKERPILFNGEMVRAILDGRKTQTRRVIKWEALHKQAGLPFPTKVRLAWFNLLQGWGLDAGDNVLREVKCPYGLPGDRLWVREAFRCNGWATDMATIFYKAHENASYTEMCEQFPVADHKPLPVDTRWRHSIYMPRWASRITLEITDVRVERLQEISEKDAESEGMRESLGCHLAVEEFMELW